MQHDPTTGHGGFRPKAGEEMMGDRTAGICLPESARGVMRFHLVYNGRLPAAGNKPKPDDVVRIRMALAPQLLHLFDTHAALQMLANDGAPVGGRQYLPLVRKSLDLMCELQVLFLRQEDPGSLILQGGDIDNRIKTLLDALKIPTKEEQERAPPPDYEGVLPCLMESDALVSRLDVDTDRLLFPQTDRAHEVHLVVEVTLNVLRVGPHNMCLL